ncbi:MAG: prepilin-type N-terminal cleavage/methylation domain-containing protein [Pseudomonadota bacterium]
MRPVSERCRSGGFTLMELLVAMTLLGMLMVVLFGSLRFGTRVWEATDRIRRDDGEAQAIRTFLRERLEQSLPLSLPLADGRYEIVFAGEETSLRMASSMPQSVGYGPYVMNFSLTAASGPDVSNELTFRWRLIDDEIGRRDNDVQERVILDALDRIRFAYFGRKEGRDAIPQWHATWREQGELPDLIRVDVAFIRGDKDPWPPLIVSTRIDEWYETSF